MGKTTVVARGPKPVAVLRELKVPITHRVPEPNTWREVLDLLDEHVPLEGRSVAVQEYGVPNRNLTTGLEARILSRALVDDGSRQRKNLPKEAYQRRRSNA